jgi:16S rRNA (cytosine967-C5)-methyltransferase
MKIFKPIKDGAIKALDEIFNQDQHAEKIVEQYLKFNKKWGSRDRKQFAELTYNVVRWARLLAEVSESKNVEKWVELYLERGEDLITNRDQLKLDVTTQESFSDEFVEILKGDSPQTWQKLLKQMNVTAAIYLRVNTLKTTTQELIHQLKKEEVDVFEVDKNVVRLKERKNVFVTDAYKKGMFEVQDWGSQKISEFVAKATSLNGVKVIDACAGAGGKSLHLAAFMKNKGKIISMDIHEWKLNELKKRAARAGVDIIETRPIDGTKAIKRLEESADILLLDVPCTGTGVIRRKPDTKWKFSKGQLVTCLSIQEEILNTYPKMLKKGGLLVYATCSLFKSENAEQVQRFLERFDGQFFLEEEMHVSPTEIDCDGFYAARIIKK